MPRGVIELKGLRQALDNLNKLAGPLRIELGHGALLAGSLVITKAVQAKTYTSFIRRSGQIKSGLGVRVGKDMKDNTLNAVVLEYPQNVGGLAGQAFSRAYPKRAAKHKTDSRGRLTNIAFWWRFIEMGTHARTTRSTPRFLLKHPAKTARQKKAVTRWAAGKSRGEIPSKPWVAPAFLASVRSATDAFQQTLRRTLDEKTNAMPK